MTTFIPKETREHIEQQTIAIKEQLEQWFIDTGVGHPAYARIFSRWLRHRVGCAEEIGQWTLAWEPTYNASECFEDAIDSLTEQGFIITHSDDSDDEWFVVELDATPLMNGLLYQPSLFDPYFLS